MTNYDLNEEGFDLSGRHICYVFNEDAERLEVMATFLKKGIAANEKLLYLVDAMTPEEMLKSLIEMGVDIQPNSPRFTISNAASAYCPSGTFNPDETLARLRCFQQAALEEGYAGGRIAGETNWCLESGHANKEALMEYEARVNQLLVKYPFTACCQYDARRFDGGTIMDVLNVHPIMIVRGQLVKNPFYIKPEVFLQEYRARHKGD